MKLTLQLILAFVLSSCSNIIPSVPTIQEHPLFSQERHDQLSKEWNVNPETPHIRVIWLYSRSRAKNSWVESMQYINMFPTMDQLLPYQEIPTKVLVKETLDLPMCQNNQPLINGICITNSRLAIIVNWNDGQIMLPLTGGQETVDHRLDDDGSNMFAVWVIGNEREYLINRAHNRPLPATNTK